MPVSSPTHPVEDSVSKVNDELAVGSDLKFQQRWWKFERIIWTIFTIFIALNIAGLFGRGPLAKARMRAADGSIDVHYERIERHQSPSVLSVQFGPNAIHDGKVQLWVSESLIRTLGNQRIAPQPETSALDRGGILYTFPATTPPVSVEFALQPASSGTANIALGVPGMRRVSAKVFVMP